ncbi:MAG: hypothetical protein ACUVXI_11690 [bacterium]
MENASGRKRGENPNLRKISVEGIITSLWLQGRSIIEGVDTIYDDLYQNVREAFCSLSESLKSLRREFRRRAKD